jgi:hypothetical protein
VPYARFVSLGSAVTSFEGVGVEGDDCVPYVPNSRFWRMLARERAALRSSTCVAVLGAAPTSAAAFDKTGAAQDAVANPIMIAPAIAVATGCLIVASSLPYPFCESWCGLQPRPELSSKVSARYPQNRPIVRPSDKHRRRCYDHCYRGDCHGPESRAAGHCGGRGNGGGRGVSSGSPM